MSRKTRLTRLETRAAPPDASATLDWANFYRRPEDIVPDGVVDWPAMFTPPDVPPWAAMEAKIAAAGAGVDRHPSGR